jgi:hypothetical protein
MLKKQIWRTATATLACVVITAGLRATPAIAQHAPPAAGGPPAAHGAFPSAVFDDTGRLWVTWVDGRHVVVASSTDRGRTFGALSRATTEPEDIDANGDARPKVVVGSAGEIYVA